MHDMNVDIWLERNPCRYTISVVTSSSTTPIKQYTIYFVHTHIIAFIEPNHIFSYTHCVILNKYTNRIIVWFLTRPMRSVSNASGMLSMHIKHSQVKQLGARHVVRHAGKPGYAHILHSIYLLELF